MNPLIKLIQINHSFQKSVNLQLDLDNYERIGSYIPTRSSIAILKRYWNIVSGKSGESASVLTLWKGKITSVTGTSGTASRKYGTGSGDFRENRKNRSTVDGRDQTVDKAGE